MILKPIIEVSSSTRYLYENFLSYDSSESDRANLGFFVHSFVNSVTHVLKNLRTQHLRTETGVRTFVNSTPGSIGGPMCVIVPNAMQISQTVVQISRFWIFQDGGSHNLGFLKFYIFNDPNDQEGRPASLYQISSKSLKPQR